MESGLPELLVEDLDRGFDELVRRHQDQLYAFALGMTGNPAEADDVAQEALVRAYRALCRYPADRLLEMRLRPWLHRIALNAFRNGLRRRPLRLVGLDQAAEVADERAVGPEASAMRGARRRELLAALAGLPPAQRAAVVLHVMEDLAYTEVSAVLRRPVGTLKSDVHRGLSALRAALAREEESA